MKRKHLAITISGIYLIFVLFVVADAKEPTRPELNIVFSPEKEERLSNLEKLSVGDCFEELKDTVFFIDDDYLNKAAYKCFKKDIDEAIEYAIEYLKQPAKTVEGEMVTMNDNHYVAKAVMRVFALESENKLFIAYRNGSAETRAHLLYAMGMMASKKAKNQLIEALDDKAVYEETYPEMEGEPMRVCDMAYNQLRLRYAEELVDLPRTIANLHRIELRDSYIHEMRIRF
jgi:hypothetical protein